MTAYAERNEQIEGQGDTEAGRQRENGVLRTPPLPLSPFPPFLGSLVPWLVLLGAFAGALGWWLPWVLHPNGAAALALLGLDLGEFLKFTSLWREGQMIWARHMLFLPPAVASLSLSLLAARTSLRWRLPATAAAALLALVLFPEFDRRGDFFTEEFWFQVSLGLTGLAVALIVLLAGPRIPRRLLAVVGLILALAGALLPVWAFWRVELVLEWLYGTQIGWGPGLWASGAGFALAAMGWGAAAFFDAGRFRTATSRSGRVTDF